MTKFYVYGGVTPLHTQYSKTRRHSDLESKATDVPSKGNEQYIPSFIALQQALGLIQNKRKCGRSRFVGVSFASQTTMCSAFTVLVREDGSAARGGETPADSAGIKAVPATKVLVLHMHKNGFSVHGGHACRRDSMVHTQMRNGKAVWESSEF